MTTNRPPVERVRPPKDSYRVANRFIGWLLSTPRRSRRVGRHPLLLHISGRLSGRWFVFPVAYREVENDRLLVLTNSDWRANLRGRSDVFVTVFGSRRSAAAQLVEDPDIVAKVYHSLIETVGHGKAGRRMGIRINVPRTPTLAELADAARREGLAVIYLDVVGASQ